MIERKYTSFIASNSNFFAAINFMAINFGREGTKKK